VNELVQGLKRQQ